MTPDFDGGVPRLLRIVGQHARHELQVALIAAAGRERLGELQRDVLSGRRAADVDDRRFRGDLDLLGDAADAQRHAHGDGLAGANQHVLVAGRREAGQLGRDDVHGRWGEPDEHRASFAISHGFALRHGVGRLCDDIDPWNGEAALILHHDFYRARPCDLGHSRAR